MPVQCDWHTQNSFVLHMTVTTKPHAGTTSVRLTKSGTGGRGGGAHCRIPAFFSVNLIPTYFELRSANTPTHRFFNRHVTYAQNWWLLRLFTVFQYFTGILGPYFYWNYDPANCCRATGQHAFGLFWTLLFRWRYVYVDGNITNKSLTLPHRIWRKRNLSRKHL